MIDKTLVLTLRRCPERHWSWIGASKIRDIPSETIAFIPGHDGEDFESMEEIVEYANADGFEFVSEYAIGTITEFTQQTKGSVTQIWNYARILREIAQGDQICLVLVDDKMITIPFGILSLIVSELRQIENEEFLALQLTQRGDLNEFEYQDRSRFDIDAYSKDVFDAIFNKKIQSYADFFLKKGLCGYDESMVLSPEGADWILHCLTNADDFYIFYDHFIHVGLTEKAKSAVENNKGIYCPKESGYIFANTIMPMKTTTNWAPEGSHHFEESVATTDVPWKDIP